MNFLRKIFKGVNFRSASMALTGMVAAAGFSSCESFYNGEGDCDPHYYVKYVYDMNMEWADAFGSQVNSVELYVFDPETGDLVAQYSEDNASALASNDYLMPIDLKPGNYDFVAWCGLSNNKENLFSLSSISKKSEAHCTLQRSYEGGKAYQKKQLNALFHGKVTASLPNTEGDHIVTVKLIKDTNNITLSMQHVSGQTLTSDMFTVTMAEANGHLGHDNSVMDDEEIEFRPWSVRSGAVDISPDTKADDSDNLNYFMAELSTSRLMADRDPRINIVDNETGNLVYSIPIVKWATTFRSEQYEDANNHVHVITDNQEYLDRQSNFEVMLYLDNKDDNGWHAAAIFINSWRVVEQNGSASSNE